MGKAWNKSRIKGDKSEKGLKRRLGEGKFELSDVGDFGGGNRKRLMTYMESQKIERRETPGILFLFYSQARLTEACKHSKNMIKVVIERGAEDDYIINVRETERFQASKD